MQYSIFKAPLYSFFSAQFYKDTAFQGKGKGFVYLLLIVFVSNLVSAVSGYIQWGLAINSSEIKGIVNQIPDLSVKNGKMSFNKPSPYTIQFVNLTKNEPVVLIFDSSGKKTKEMEDAAAVFTEDGIVMGDAEPVPWNSFGENWDLPLTRVQQFLKAELPLYLFVGSAFVFFPLCWVSHILLAMIYALVGLVMDRNKLGYETALRMACVAMTPTIILTGLLTLIWKPPFWELLTMPISLGYLFFGYNSVGDNTKAE